MGLLGWGDVRGADVACAAALESRNMSAPTYYTHMYILFREKKLTPAE